MSSGVWRVSRKSRLLTGAQRSEVLYHLGALVHIQLKHHAPSCTHPMPPPHRTITSPPGDPPISRSAATYTGNGSSGHGVSSVSQRRRGTARMAATNCPSSGNPSIPSGCRRPVIADELRTVLAVHGHVHEAPRIARIHRRHAPTEQRAKMRGLIDSPGTAQAAPSAHLQALRRMTAHASSIRWG